MPAYSLKPDERRPAAGTVGQFEVLVMSGGDSAVMSAASEGATTTTDELSLTLAPVPDQQMLAPTEEDSAVFKLGGGTASSLIFNWSAFQFDIFDFDFVNEVRLIPFFDGRGSNPRSPALAHVGRLFRVRGADSCCSRSTPSHRRGI